MCGIAGIVSLDGKPIDRLVARLDVMGELLAHRGPDDLGAWINNSQSVGLVHRRLSIIDLSSAAHQPMSSSLGTTIVFNGEIYNYPELRSALKGLWHFKSQSDTECILAAHDRHGSDCLDHLRGMFAFALWDERRNRLFCARDRFGIKPFYYVVNDNYFLFASECKALLPFLDDIETDPEALAEYFTFQYTIGAHTLFNHIKQLLPGHALSVEGGHVQEWRYWDVHYEVDIDHSATYFQRRLEELIDDSVRLHVRSDVPLGSYLSGGIDSSLVAIMAARADTRNNQAFHGKFTAYPGYDESHYARDVANQCGVTLHEVDISAEDFRRHINDVIFHLDFPVAGPGSFPQFMVSKLASEHVKVVLGGQGGDEIFGGYARYLLAYFEQCIKAAIDGTYKNGNFIVTIESIVPNLGLLREYKPLIKQFWQDGLFGSLDDRYFRLIDRSTDMRDEVDWSQLDKVRVFEEFKSIFNNWNNVKKEAYFDRMTHFDFKCQLPALLHVEDRMSMAHGLESRVPFLDHPLIEFVATIPADIKFLGGEMKHLIKNTFKTQLPKPLLERRDKMGFPVPLKEWMNGELKGFIHDTFNSERARSRPYINSNAVCRQLDSVGQFSRKLWGLLSLELWQQCFHDRAPMFRGMIDEANPVSYRVS